MRARHDPSVFLFIGIIVLFAYLVVKFAKAKKAKDDRKRANDILKNGHSIEIDLEKAKINYRLSFRKPDESSWRQESLVDLYRNETTNNAKPTEVHSNEVTVDFEYDGKPQKFTTIVMMEPENLRMWFALKRNANLYVDKRDPMKRCLDLSFLGLEQQLFFETIV